MQAMSIRVERDVRIDPGDYVSDAKSIVPFYGGHEVDIFRFTWIQVKAPHLILCFGRIVML